MDLRQNPAADRPMRLLRSRLPLHSGAALALLALPLAVTAGEPPPGGKPPPRPAANTPKEPLAPALSLAKSAEFLDAVTLAWLKERKCASCHTGFPYLLARPALGDPKAPALLTVRKYLEDRVAGWDRGGKGAGYLKAEGPLKVSEGVTEVVAAAATLALHDAQSTGKLHPRTRQALGRMWELQRADGSWEWNKTALLPWSTTTTTGPCTRPWGSATPRKGTPRASRPRKGWPG